MALGAGHSSDPDTARAATEALRAALAGRRPEQGDLVFAFVDVVHDPATLMRTLEVEAAPATVVGCSAQGSFTTDAAGPHALSVLHVPADGLSSGVASVEAPDGDLYEAARAAAAKAKDAAGEQHPHSALVVLSSATGAQRDVVRGAYEITGARVPLIGGAAASNPDMDSTWHGSGGEVVHEGVTAVWLNSHRPLGVAMDHGWRPISRPLLVTSARDNVILELDGRPACDVYLEARGRPYEEDAGPFGWEAIDLPLGLPTIGGGYEVRHIWNRTDEGGLEMFGYIHDQAVVRVMNGDRRDLLDGAHRAVRAATNQLDGPPRGALVFSCTARLVLLGDAIDEERQAIRDELGASAATGLFTSGEYCRVTGSTGFHNASVAVLAW